MSRLAAQKRISGWAVGALLLLSGLFWADCVFGPNTPLAAGFQAQMEPWVSEADIPGTSRQWSPLLWDGVAQFYPWRLHAARTLRGGELALWNRHQFCGYPFVGNAQSALFYPPNWLLALVDVRRGLGLLAALHYAVASLLTYLLARRIGLGDLPALFAGIAFAWGGFMVTWTELPTLMNAAAWLPGALLGIHLIFERSRWGVPTLAGSLALTMLAGHLQIAAYVWLTAIAYMGARVAWALIRRQSTRWAELVGAMVIATLLCGAGALPALELGMNSTRGAGGPTQAGWRFHAQRALQPAELLALADPDAFGSPVDGNHELTRYGIPYSEHCGYVGLSTLVLALAGLASSRTRHWAFFALVALAALSVAMGGPLARWMYFGVPKLGQAGGFTRILSVFTFAAAMAGAAGLDGLRRWMASHLVEATRRRPVGELFALGMAIVLACELIPWAYEFLPRSNREHVYPLTPAIERLLEADGRVLAVTSREEWTMAHTPSAVLPPNSATVYGYDSIAGYDSLFPRNYRTFLSAAEGTDPAPLVNGNMLLPEQVIGPGQAVMGVSRALTVKPREDSEAAALIGRHGGASLYGISPVVSRAFIAPKWLCALDGRALPPSEEIVAAIEPCEWREDGNGIRAVKLPGEWSGSVLVFVETFYPGWNAYVDGASREVSSSIGTFCGVSIRDGDDEVRLVFEPVSVRFGIFLSLVGLGTLVGLCVARRTGRDNIE